MIRAVLMNLFLACAFMALFGTFTIGVFLLGLVLGAFLLTIYSVEAGRANYAGNLWRLLRFCLYFIRILWWANIEVAWEIITPKFHMTPGFIRYPVHDLTPVQITMLANCITLTPGTLSADLDEDARVLYIHCMYAGNREKRIHDIDELKTRLLEGVFHQ